MKPVDFRRAALPLLFLALVFISVVLMVVLRDGGNRSGERDAYSSDRSVSAHTLVDAPRAQFISLFIAGDNGIASLMVGGRTEEFGSITDTLKNSQPAAGTEDETFSDLLVIYFGEKDTLEVSYSRTRNLLQSGGVIYQPPADLAPVLKSVEEKTAY